MVYDWDGVKTRRAHVVKVGMWLIAAAIALAMSSTVLHLLRHWAL